MAHWTRRDLLKMGAASGLFATTGMPLPAHALSGSRRRFVFVFARGGWDTTRVFSPMFHAPAVETEDDAAPVTSGDLAWVDHPDRPAVRGFFEDWGDRVAVVDGMLVRSVNHQVCERLVLTGDARRGNPDWPSILGAQVSSEHALPNIVMNHPSIPGPLHRTTSILGRAEQLQGLVDGSAAERGDLFTASWNPESLAAVDDALRWRVGARLESTRESGRVRMLEAAADGLDRIERLAADAQLVDFAANTFTQQIDTAIDLLQHGVARSVCIGESGFDTHSVNALQSRLHEDLFSGLRRLMNGLASTPGTTEATLLDETVVVVASEMGRTPYLNGNQGKDHWPYTALMMLGAGVQGGRRIGGYDDTMNGQPIDLATGAITSSGIVATPQHVGATLLTLADIDPAEWLPDVPAIGAFLA